MPPLDRILGRVIAEQRLRAEMSQEVLAHHAKVHPTYISQLERGLKSPTVRVLAAIATSLGIPASELLRRAEARR